MRVLITTDTVGGVWDYSLTLVEGLLERGSEVILVSLGGALKAHQRRQMRRLADRWANSLTSLPTDYPLEWMQGDLRMEESRKYLLSTIKRHSPEVLHFNQMCYGNLRCDIPTIVVSHSDLTSWWQHCYQALPPQTDWSKQYHVLVSAGLRGADVVVAPSRFQLQQVTRHYCIAEEKGTVIYNGSQARVVSEAKCTQAVTAGRFWDPAKNLQVLSKIKWRLPVYVVGELEPGGMNDADKDAGQNPRSLGSLDKQAFYNLLDESLIYIGPSLYEPFGLAPLEAAHSGCVLVLSSIDSFHEIWGDTAVYISPDKPETLQRVIDHLLADRDYCRSMAALSRQRAQALYNQANFIENYVGLYQKLLSGTGATYAA